MVIVLFGVSGCGKSTIGQMLADHLDWLFIDADDHHPVENIEKMRRGIALNDEDRGPWLQGLADMIATRNHQGHDTILACSALKQDYRDLLDIDQQRIVSVFLKGSIGLIQSRLQKRKHAFMSDNLLRSQFDTLEIPDDGLIINIAENPQRICNEIARKLKL